MAGIFNQQIFNDPIFNTAEAPVVSGGGGSRQTFQDKRRIKLKNTSEQKFILFLKNRVKSKLTQNIDNLTRSVLFFEDRNLIESLIRRDLKNQLGARTVYGLVKAESLAKYTPFIETTQKRRNLTLLKILDSLD